MQSEREKFEVLEETIGIIGKHLATSNPAMAADLEAYFKRRYSFFKDGQAMGKHELEVFAERFGISLKTK